ncbi:hypothetical protein AU468_00935 [Alkalispirochaeta sphaeroplastigenens]|uniref:Uncharacterized protein n=1 Tax=Alkalispirochaeta sphaeroplastigenens TaxID=1187066 RepID=A0A2S4K123_9SPIO|nr:MULTISPECIES: hypothetical protein [Alkalispirochaeta]POR05470.1 hypothetical protein AU468_00935 [Alkalispirochaeta sphaeroplastigenens]
MREMLGHGPGKVYLLFLLATVVALAATVFTGLLELPPGGEPILIFGWMTMPLFTGVSFVAAWLVSYVIYFFFFWPYR